MQQKKDDIIYLQGWEFGAELKRSFNSAGQKPDFIY